MFDQDKPSLLSKLPKDLSQKMLSYLKSCVKLTHSMIHNLSKHIHLTFTPHVFITHNYDKIRDTNNKNCYYLYLFVGDIYNDESDNDEYNPKPSIYLPKLKHEINDFLRTKYGIYTEITFYQVEKIELGTVVDYEDFPLLQDVEWLDRDIISNTRLITS